MLIATFNINNVTRRLPNLLAWLEAERPDVVAVQELKADTPAFPAAVLRDAGYHAAWVGEPRWNGVALLARTPPVVTRRALPGDNADTQARYIEAAIDGILFASIYLPNGNPQPGPKFAYKLAWFERLIAHARELHASGAPVALLGDYNVVPTAADIYPTRSFDDNALLQPAPREAWRRLVALGYTDALRTLQPEGPLWTFWDYKRQRWQNDKGLRLDHILLTPDLAARLAAGGVHRSVRGEPEASDHAPAWVRLRRATAPKIAPRPAARKRAAVR